MKFRHRKLRGSVQNYFLLLVSTALGVNPGTKPKDFIYPASGAYPHHLGSAKINSYPDLPTNALSICPPRHATPRKIVPERRRRNKII